MEEKFVIEGGKSLKGEIAVKGYKNSAGAVLAASILAEGGVTLSNIPRVLDIENIVAVLESMGAEAKWISGDSIKISARDIDPRKIDSDKFSKTRISVMLIGSLLGLSKNFKLPHPGGDKIGLRPILTHMEAIEKLGAEISEEEGWYSFSFSKLRGNEIFLKEFSVTATETAMIAGAKAEGRTVIKGAASEPQVRDLADFLSKMGAKISWEGCHNIKIEGVKELKGGFEHRIIPDPIEAGTFISAAAITGGRVLVKDIIPDHLDFFLDKAAEIGVDFEVKENAILVKESKGFKSSRVQALPYPGFPTDLLPIIAPLLTQAEGRSLLHDPLYENRFGYTHELRKMGADIELVDPHRAFVFGKTNLSGSIIEGGDIRAGATLVVAALAAKGRTTIKNVGQIDRGYEQIEERLKNIGAAIERQ